MYPMPLRTDTPQPGTSTTPPVALAVGSVAAAHSSRTARSADKGSPAWELRRVLAMEVCPSRTAAAYIAADVFVEETVAEAAAVGLFGRDVLLDLLDRRPAYMAETVARMYAAVDARPTLSEPQRRDIARAAFPS